ncbi:MAG: NAD kinase [Bacteroidetes bacterium]|nr:NAD kinase [Bacteroidota bacterium]
MKVALFGKTISGNDVPYLQGFIDRLRILNCIVYLFEPFYNALREKIHFENQPLLFTTQQEIRGEVEYLFSIGGDGTLLDTITLVGDSKIPVIGINMGRLGFLSGISKEEILPALDDLIGKKYTIDERTLLRLESAKPLFGEFNYALNDFSIHKSSPQSLLAIKLFVNDDFLNTYWADGLIVATPTGSTAYSMSCTGPILSPDSENFVITPIASHNLTVRPIVIPDTCIIRIIIESRNVDCYIGLDSRIVRLEVPTELVIKKEDFKICLVRMSGRNFFETIRAKLKWGLDIRN